MDQDEAPQAALAEMGSLLRGFQVARMIQVAAELGLADRVAEGPAADGGARRRRRGGPGDAPPPLPGARGVRIFAVEEEGRARGRPPARPGSRHGRAPPCTTPRATGECRAPGRSGAASRHTVRTGVPAQEARFGMAFFPLLASRPEEAERFDAFMRNSPDDRHRAVAAAWDFAGARLVVDVGGGNGGLLAAILAAFPRCGASSSIARNVVAGAPAALGDSLDRCDIVAGDFFEAVPSGGDVYLLAQVLHDWSDARCATILAACRAGDAPGRAAPGGRAPARPGADPMNHLADMHMMLLFPGARERTAEEYRGLLEAAGFGGLPRRPDRLALSRPRGAEA